MGCYVAEGRNAQRGQHLPSKITQSIAKTTKARDQLSLPDVGISGTQPDGLGPWIPEFEKGSHCARQ